MTDGRRCAFYKHCNKTLFLTEIFSQQNKMLMDKYLVYCVFDNVDESRIALKKIG